MSRMVCGCGEPLKDGMGFCGPCRESLGLPPVPKPVKRSWSEKERVGFAERQARDEDLRRRIDALPEPAIDDPFVGIGGAPLGSMRHTGAGGVR
jgi:hypothetical protein